MRKSTSSLRAAAKGGGLTVALAAALMLGAGTTPASAHVTGFTPMAVTDDTDNTCAAVEVTLEAVQQRLETAYEADKRALEKLRETVGDHNDAARHLLKKAEADLKNIFRTTDATLDNDVDDADCATVDEAALTALVDQATTDMDAVVNTATTAIAALPVDQAKADDDEDDD